jgi:hypothetical protein
VVKVTRFYLAALIIIILLLGCAKDIIVKPPNTPKGVYNGLYTVITNYGSSSGATTRDQWIEWTFTDYKFYSKATKTDLKPQEFCDVSGNYSITSNITLSDTLVSVDFTCTHSDVPSGSFSYRTKAGVDGGPDSAFMEQLEGTTKKIIVLERVTQ